MFIVFQEGYVLDIKLQSIGIAVFLAPFEGASSYHQLCWWSMISSAAEIRAEVPTGAVNRSTEPVGLFDVSVWIDYPNQVDRFYGGYGPGLYFFVEPTDIVRFAGELQSELDGLGSYFTKRK